MKHLSRLKKFPYRRQRRRSCVILIVFQKFEMRHFEFFRSPGMTQLFRPRAVAVVFCLFFFNQIQSADKTPANRYRWPGGVVPFVIDPNVPRPERIYSAIHQWAELTPIRLVPRTRETNYVRFVRENNDGLCF